MEYLAEGKRGIVFIDTINSKKVVVKKEKRNLGRVKLEARWLRKLNAYKIGPKLIESGEDYLICEYAEGDLFSDYYEKYGKEKSKKVIKEILRQCRVLDKLNLNKFEMHNPVKHIIVGKRVVMIDFERCIISESPKNVTQFVQFLTKLNFIRRSDDLMELLKNYKYKQDDKNYKKLVNFILQ